MGTVHAVCAALGRGLGLNDEFAAITERRPRVSRSAIRAAFP